MTALSGKVDPVGNFPFGANTDRHYAAEKKNGANVSLDPIPLTRVDEQLLRRLDILSQQVDELARLNGFVAVKVGMMQRELTELIQQVNGVAQGEEAEMEATAQKVAAFAIDEDSSEEAEESGLDSSWEMVGEEPKPPPPSPVEQEYEEY